jgi:hypothetical protein
MKDKVKDAIKNIETDLMYGNPGSLDAVSRWDVETLLKYTKKRLKKAENRTTDLEIGDKAALRIDWSEFEEGTVGKVVKHRDDNNDENFPWGLQLPGRSAVVYFAREELEKVN